MSKTDNNALYCGIDLHSRSATIALKDQNGKVIRKAKTPNELPRVLDLLDPYQANIQAIAIESTFNWYWLVDGLMEKGYAVQLANPAAFEQYGGIKNANDNTDAIFLAEMLRLGILPTGYIYPKQERGLRDLLRRRLLLVRQRTLHHLSLQSLIARHSGQSLSSNQIKKLKTQQLTAYLSPPILLAGQITHQARCWLDQAIIRIEKELQKQVTPREDFQLLQSVPGIGPILGTTIALETGTIERFASPGNYASCARCVKSEKISNGKYKGQGNKKNGNKYLAWAFMEAAHYGAIWSTPIKRYYQRKQAKSHILVAKKAVANKLARACYHMLKRGEVFDVTRAFG